MQRFTGTRADFERLATTGLVLRSDIHCCYLYYHSGSYRYLDDSFIPYAERRKPDVRRYHTYSETLSGGWSLLDCRSPELYVVPSPVIYRRHS